MALQKVVLRLPQDQINVLFEEASRVGVSIDVLLAQMVRGACTQIREANRETARAEEAKKKAAAASSSKKKESDSDDS